MMENPRDSGCERSQAFQWLNVAVLKWVRHKRGYPSEWWVEAQLDQFQFEVLFSLSSSAIVELKFGLRSFHAVSKRANIKCDCVLV